MNGIEVVLPTRGVIHAATLTSLQQNDLYRPHIVSGLPIPDSFNVGVKKALESYPGYVLIVEDDMQFPPGVIERMVKRDEAIVALNYPMDNGYETMARKNGEILWCGLGCVLIKAGVFKNLPQPWFETDHSWKINEENGTTEFERIENPSKYGGHDINFCMKARKYGFTIACLEEIEAQHMRVKTLERNDRSNSGGYEIHPLPAISNRQNY